MKTLIKTIIFIYFIGFCIEVTGQNKILRLVINRAGYSGYDETVLYFNTKANNAYDAYDSEKRFSTEANDPQIYTKLGTRYIVINGMNSPETNPSVAVGYKTTAASPTTHTITATEISNFTSSQNVYLKDNDLNITQNLKTNPVYTFTSTTVADNMTRFSVLFCISVNVTSVTAAANPICSSATTTLTANGVSGTNATVTWWTGSGGTGTNLGTGLTLADKGPGTYYARVTGDCGSPAEASLTVSSKINAGITSVSAAANPICSSATTTLTANGVSGTNATVTWWTGSGGTGTNLGTGQTLTDKGPGTYYARVTGDCGSPAEAFLIITALPQWLGTIDNDWSKGGNWCGGVAPTSGTSITVLSGTIEISNEVGSPAECDDLTIESGAQVIIKPGAALTVHGTTTLNGAQALVIQSDATGTGSFIDNGIIGSGTAKVEKYLQGTSSARWWYLGSPITNATGASFGTLSQTASTGTRLLYWNEPTQAYVSVLTANALNPVRGYSFREYTLPNQTANFIGSLNTGNKNASLTRTGPNTAYVAYNLVSNPYPSSVDIMKVKSGISNLDPTIWYKSGNNYPTVNLTTGIPANDGSPNVPAMQAFWVKVKLGEATGSINFTNAARQHSGQSFFKTLEGNNIFRLEVFGLTEKDEAVVAFFPDAKSIFDDYDSDKMFSTAVDIPQIYTLTDDNHKTIINSFPVLKMNEERIVTLGFSTKTAGTFTFKATNLSSFDDGISVFLEDKLQQVSHDLRSNNTYTFTSAVVDNADRFKLHFTSLGTDIGKQENISVVNIYSSDKNIYIKVPENKSAFTELYDMLGKKVTNKQLKGGLNELSLKLEDGIYIVKVIYKEGIVVKKVFIK